MSRTRRTNEGHGKVGSALSSIAVALGCVLFLGGFVWGAILYQPYTVPTDSMDPTIKAGDRVLAERVDGSEIKRGDVVVFQENSWGNVPMVKRVVAVGGDKVACCTDKQLTVNGKRIDEPYLPKGESASLTGIKSTSVPKGRLFLLGDHRADSLDSSMHIGDSENGSVERGAVKGRVDALAWPMSALQKPTGFEALPGGISQPGPFKPALGAIVAGAVLVLGGAAYGPIAKRKQRSRGRAPEPVRA